MSYDTNKYWFYQIKGRKLRLYKLLQNNSGAVDNQGRVTASRDDTLIYPDETITNGLRIEYRRLYEPFIDDDPTSVLRSEDDGVDGGWEEDSTPSEASHVNLNRMKSLAIIDYLKAMKADMAGDIELKEYYIKEFWTRLANDQSNKKHVSMVFPSGAYALR
jgi:hypothetical protein